MFKLEKDGKLVHIALWSLVLALSLVGCASVSGRLVQPTPTEAELGAIEQEVNQLVHELGFPFSTAVDVEGKRVVLWVTDRAQFEAALQDAGRQLPEHVEVLVVDQPPLQAPAGITPVPDVAFPQLQARSTMHFDLGPLQGKLLIKGGCLRVSESDEEAGRLIIWQPDYFLNNNQGTVEVLDREGKVVARVGEPISLAAAGVTDWERQLREPLPEQCPGPYWVMDGIVPKLRTLDDTEWVLTSLRGQPLLPGTTINLSFEEVTFSGSAGCNRYGGEYAATDDGSLSRPMLEVTVMGCTEPEGVMEQEQAYIAAFASIATYQLSEDRLELQDASRETILVYARQAECMEEPANLAGTAWQLVSVDGQEPMEGSDTTLAFFDDKWLAESSKCEAYVSAYQTSGHELRLVFEAWLGWTCQDEEGQGTTTLGSPTQTCLVQGRLQITTLRGQVFTYEPLSEAARPALEGSTWSLLSIVEERWIEGEAVPVPDPNTVLEGTEITLTLEGGAAGGSAGCNDYGAVYTLDGASLALGDVVATERGCSTPEGVMEQEERYLVALKDVTGYRMVGSQLWLLAGDRRALVFSVKA